MTGADDGARPEVRHPDGAGDPGSTQWSMVRGAAAGDEVQRERFARLYLPVVRAYLGARWHANPLLAELEDAVQEVFVDCFRRDGALVRAAPGSEHGFRRFLYGVTRNVARRFEQRTSRSREVSVGSGPDVGAEEQHLSEAFDRAWLRSLLVEALQALRLRAEHDGEGARRRFELLRLRFHEDMPIRNIAALWEVDPARLHKEYARARDEFRQALQQVLAPHLPAGAPVEQECRRLLEHFR